MDDDYVSKDHNAWHFFQFHCIVLHNTASERMRKLPSVDNKRERVTIWQNIKDIFISFVYCWTITHFYRIMVWKIKQRILTKRMQQHWSQLLFNIELSKMFLSMMFERSLKSNIDGIEHSLTFDQKKLAFEIMTSAFFFNISLCLGLQRLFVIWLMHILSISALILILHNYFFYYLKICIGEKLRFFKKTKNFSISDVKNP